jgi:hypothetical protein
VHLLTAGHMSCCPHLVVGAAQPAWSSSCHCFCSGPLQAPASHWGQRPPGQTLGRQQQAGAGSSPGHPAAACKQRTERWTRAVTAGGSWPCGGAASVSELHRPQWRCYGCEFLTIGLPSSLVLTRHAWDVQR